jgi:H+/gluconate symporter-like permease
MHNLLEIPFSYFIFIHNVISTASAYNRYISKQAPLGAISALVIAILAAMIHAGATVLDHLPHGSFFHATAGSVIMEIKEGLKLMPY